VRERSLLCPTLAPGGVAAVHRVAYVEWGPPDAPHAVVCAHGLARTGRDFDPLAAALAAAGVRVVCPDLPGRGRSDWLDRQGYTYPQYVVDCLALVARLDVATVDWVGTSMGGLVGISLAALAGNPVRRLVVNDVGPFVPGPFLDVLAGYLGRDPDFGSVEEVEAYLRRVYTGFGDLPDEHWRHLARHGHRRKPGGALGLAYDPAIAAGLVPPMPDLDLRPLWAAVRCPTLVLRGEDSPALPADVAAGMTTTGPRATLVTVPGCAHAPPLVAADQVATVVDWLTAAPAPPTRGAATSGERTGFAAPPRSSAG
jgi:pimeloyl-ACP methyl ester carboxylesterase